MSLKVFDDLEQATDAALALIERAAVESVQARGRFLLVVSGGSTPAELFRRMGQMPAVDQLPWTAMEIFFADERNVGPADPQSNYGLLKRTLLDAAPIPPAHVHRIQAESGPSAAADAYEAEIRQTLALGVGVLPRFDLILLGMGPDGHTASLFPHTAALSVRDRLVVANHVPQLQTDRVTLTVPVLDEARAVAFLVSGTDKAAALQAVLNGPFNPEEYPSQLVQPRDGSRTLLVDRAAAAQLRPSL